MDIVETFAATLATRSEQIAYIGSESTLSWGDVDVLTSRVLSLLAGVPVDAAVGILARNRPPVLATIVRLFMEQRDMSMLYAYQPKARLIEQIHALRLSVIVGHHLDFGPEFREFAESEGVLLIELHDRRAEPTGLLKREDWQVRGYHRLPNRGGVEMLTSGTTGPPKRLVLHRGALEAAIIDAIGIVGYSSSVSDSKPLVSLLTFPVGNISGIGQVIPLAVLGHTLCVLEKFNVADYVGAIKHYPQTMLALPPAAIRMILEAEVAPETFKDATYCITGSSALDPLVQLAFEKRFGMPILCAYGATEFSGIVSSWSLDARKRFGNAKLGSVGQAVPNVRIRIVDPDSSQPLQPGSIGLIEVLAKRVGDYWLTTNDLGYLDEDGFLFIKGRADGVIIRGGFKIDPVNVCTALRRHPAVADAECIGKSDTRLGQVPAAAVELVQGQPAPTEAELIEFLGEILLAYEIPVTIAVVDSLPRTLSMKVEQATLRTILGIGT